MNQLLAYSKNGIQVMYDPINSHAATHIEDTPQLKELLKEAISRMTLTNDEIKTHINMGRVIGFCDIVDTDKNDEIVYGIRKNREDDGLVPFVKNRRGKPSSDLAMHLIRQPGGEYILQSTWIGVFDEKNDEPFPHSVNATQNSVNFWNKHAFVYGSQEIKDGTETNIYPWKLI